MIAVFGMYVIFLIIWAVMMLVSLAAVVVMVIALWKLFEKIGEPGWKAIIPFYNSYVLSELTLGNGLFFLIGFVPTIGILIFLLMYYRLAECFGKSTTFCVLSIFFPYVTLPMMAFSKEEITYDASKARFF